MPAQLTVWLIIDRKKKNTGAQWCPLPTVSRQPVSSLAGEGHRLPAFSVLVQSVKQRTDTTSSMLQETLRQNGLCLTFSSPYHSSHGISSLQHKVLLYLHSTSNHNYTTMIGRYTAVVLYLHSTSNHNFPRAMMCSTVVVLYLHSTSNHNNSSVQHDQPAVVLYLHSTSNHNYRCTCAPFCPVTLSRITRACILL